MAVATTRWQDVVSGLQPEPVWRFFGELTQIPRPSKHEEKVLKYLKDFAETRNLSWEQDDVGNMVIRRPGSGGGEAAPTVVVQGHIDMVCEKDSHVAHDFFTDPLTLRREGDWLQAQGTTLGADNGIGVAAALALLDLPRSAKLPPLECLFTVDEETGLTGAFGIHPSLLQGRTLLNLDTEDWGEVFIGCAGGGDATLLMDVSLEGAPQGWAPATLRLSGLLGGHSGLNIHEGRGNAVQLVARCVAGLAAALQEASGGLRLMAIKGGDKRNAIAREAEAQLLLPPGSEAAAQAAAADLLAQLQAEYGTLEQGLALTLELTPAQADHPLQHQQQAGCCIAAADAERLLTLLRALPHGPHKFSHAVPGLVETSNNVASVQVQPQPEGAPAPGPGRAVRYAVVTCTRSSLGHSLEALRDVVQGLARLAGCCEVKRGKAYPGWAPKLDSDVLQVVLAAYRDLQGGRDARVGAIHAGLECGILGERFPGMDMVSFGPTIKGAHSPEERVQISTVAPFWALMLEVLARLADRR